MFWTSDSDSSRKTMCIAGWKRLETPNLVKQTPTSILKQFCLKPEQWVKLLQPEGNILEKRKL